MGKFRSGGQTEGGLFFKRMLQIPRDGTRWGFAHLACKSWALFRKARLSREDDVYVLGATDVVVVTRIRAEHLKSIDQYRNML